MMLAPNFDSEEFRCKDGSLPLDDLSIFRSLKELAALLQVVRDDIGEPIRVISGYRSLKYNYSVGSKKTSQHVKAKAADIVSLSYEPYELHARIKLLHKEGLIRVGGLGLYKSFVHVDVRPGRLARWKGSGVV